MKEEGLERGLAPTVVVIATYPAPVDSHTWTGDHPERRHAVSSIDEKMHVPTAAELQSLGTRRPEIFKSFWAECGFCFAVTMSMFIAEFLISGFTLILPSLVESLNIPPLAETWAASSFALVIGALLLPMSRAADILGGPVFFKTGLVWFTLWTLVSALSPSYEVLIVCRCMQAIGAAAFLSTGIMLIGSIYRPGPRKNVAFSIYGSFTPLGFFGGIMTGAVVRQLASWRAYYWTGTVLAAVVVVVALFAIPRLPSPHSSPSRSIRKEMDWWGCLAITAGLVLTTYALTRAPDTSAGFASPSIAVCLALGLLALVVAFYIEGWRASHPILPFSLFRAPGMVRMVVALFMQYGIFGIWLYYTSFFFQTILQAPPLEASLYFVPSVVAGVIIYLGGGSFLHLIPGRALLIIAGLGNILCCLLLAIMPPDGSFWAWILPAMVGWSLGVEISFNVSNVFITTSLPLRHQSAAGGLIHTLLFVGISFWLAIANLVVSATNHQLASLASFRVAYWLALAMSVAALAIFATVSIGRADTDLTCDEKDAVTAATLHVRSSSTCPGPVDVEAAETNGRDGKQHRPMADVVRGIEEV